MKKQSKKINLDASTSLPVNSPQTPKFPLHSPLTPNTPQTPNPLNFSPTLPTFQELGDNLDNLLG